MRSLILMVVAMLLSGEAIAQKTVSFPTEDGGVLYANAFGKSDKAVVLAHGGQFNKESWDKQAHGLVAVGSARDYLLRGSRNLVGRQGKQDGQGG